MKEETVEQTLLVRQVAEPIFTCARNQNKPCNDVVLTASNQHGTKAQLTWLKRTVGTASFIWTWAICSLTSAEVSVRISVASRFSYFRTRSYKVHKRLQCTCRCGGTVAQFHWLAAEIRFDSCATGLSLLCKLPVLHLCDRTILALSSETVQLQRDVRLKFLTFFLSEMLIFCLFLPVTPEFNTSLHREFCIPRYQDIFRKKYYQSCYHDAGTQAAKI